jgi:hypothetical protein
MIRNAPGFRTAGFLKTIWNLGLSSVMADNSTIRQLPVKELQMIPTS